MKIRFSYVSNSSSASFIVNKVGLSSFQEFVIKNWEKIAEFIYGLAKDNKEFVDIDDFFSYYDILWDIKEYSDYYDCYTNMDNFDLNEFFGWFGILTSNYWHS